MAQHPNWHVITGGPSTGKTTLQQALAKLGYATLSEAARMVIDAGMANGATAEEFRYDERSFQDEIIRQQVELERDVPSNQTYILDRGILDPLAYYQFYKFDIEPWVKELVDEPCYGLVFVMEPLGFFKQDYARTEVKEFNDYITDLFMDVYKEYGMDPILLPAVSVEERVKTVCEYIQQYETEQV